MNHLLLVSYSTCKGGLFYDRSKPKLHLAYKIPRHLLDFQNVYNLIKLHEHLNINSNSKNILLNIEKKVGEQHHNHVFCFFDY